MLLHAVCCAAVLFCVAADARSTVNVAWLSDIHYDPYYNTPSAVGHCTTGTASPMGQPKCDAPLALVRAAIDDVKARRPDYVVMSGDWLRHSMDALPLSDAVPTFNSVAAMLGEIGGGVFPLPNLAGALGNNDFIPDYYFNESAPTHPLLANLTEVLVNNSLLEAPEGATFARCGYFYREVANSSLSILSLNTLVWTVMLEPTPASPASDPCGQMHFLQRQLERARVGGRRVLVVSHVPIGVNLYNVLHGGFGAPEAVYFQNVFALRYRTLIANYSAVIIAQLFGHTHRFSFVADKLFGVPAFTAPSITPIYLNNPSYLQMTLDATTLDLVDLQLRFLAPSKASWLDGPTLRAVLNVPQLTVASIHDAIADTLLTNASVWNAVVLAYGGGIADGAFPVSPCDASCRTIFSCAMREALLADVVGCTASTAAPQTNGPQTSTPQPKAPGTKTRNILIGGIVGGVAVLAVVGAVLWRKTKCIRFFSTEREELIVNTEE